MPTPTQTVAPLRDIFRWLPHTRNVADNPYLDPRASENFRQGSSGSDDWEYYETGGGEGGIYEGHWRVRPGSRLDQLNQQYNLDAQVNPDNNTNRAQFNYSQLPLSRFGSIENIVPVEDYGPGAINPALVYDDPNYGRITHQMNVRRPNAWVGPLLMTIASMGAGSLVGAAGGASAAQSWNAANSALRGLQSGMNGRFNPIQLASLASGAFGNNIPGLQQASQVLNNPWTRIAAYLAQQAAARNSRGRG